MICRRKGLNNGHISTSLMVMVAQIFSLRECCYYILLIYVYLNKEEEEEKTSLYKLKLEFIRIKTLKLNSLHPGVLALQPYKVCPLMMANVSLCDFNTPFSLLPLSHNHLLWPSRPWFRKGYTGSLWCMNQIKSLNLSTFLGGGSWS